MTLERGCEVPVPTVAEIHSGRLRRNLAYVRELAGAAEVMAVVKADAYGHHVDRVIPVLQDQGVDKFAVATPAEGAGLRRRGVEGEILVMGRVLLEAVPACSKYGLSIAVSSMEEVTAALGVLEDRDSLDIHVNIDTGMGRLGVSVDEAPTLITRLDGLSRVRVRAIWSHFATADEPESPVVRQQWERFKRVVERLRAEQNLPDLHVANSGALLYHREMLDIPCAVVRTGLALYGYQPNPALPADEHLQPVMDVFSRVVHIKTVPAGTPVSYTHSWKAPRRTRVGTLAAGYGDGYRRALSNGAQVRIKDSLYPVVGKVCMDMMMIDLGSPDARSGHLPVAVGDRALLFGAEGPTAGDLAGWADTIPYEILCGISQRVSRCIDVGD